MNRVHWLPLFSLLAASGVHAADTYVGVDVLEADYEKAGLSQALAPKALLLKYGIRADPNLGLEFRLGTGISDGERSQVTVSAPLGAGVADAVAVDVDLLMGVYGKATLPFNENFEIYGLAGLTAFETDTTIRRPGVTTLISENDTEFSYGAGFVFRPDSRTAITTEYTLLVDNDTLQVTTLSLGFAFRF